ncbi:hypothetical protein Droror1_Dr00012257 [Drosera rotundifolia]
MQSSSLIIEYQHTTAQVCSSFNQIVEGAFKARKVLSWTSKNRRLHRLGGSGKRRKRRGRESWAAREAAAVWSARAIWSATETAEHAGRRKQKGEGGLWENEKVQGEGAAGWEAGQIWAI